MTYTPDLTKQIISDYEANPTRENVDVIADRIGKPSRSVIAKLAAAGVYNTPAKTTKTGDLIIKKEELVADIEKWLNIVAPSLAKTNKLDLRELHRAVECKTGNTHTKTPTNT